MTSKQEHELFPEDELSRLFEPRRPDPDAFRAGVERRLEALRRAEGERRDAEGRAPLRSAVLRRVAALLPVDPGLGATASAFAGGKLLPAALALPALTLTSALGGFFAATRSISRASGQPGAGALSESDASAPRRAGARLRKPLNVELAWGGRLLGLAQFGGLLAFVAGFLFGGQLALDVLVLALLVSMASLAASVRGFAQLGLLSRDTLARLCVGLLLAIFGGCFLWFHSIRVAHDTSDLGIGWSAGAVWLGVLACLFMGRRTMKGAWAFGALMVLLALLNPFGLTRSSPAALRAQFAGLEPRADDLSRWREAAALHAALAAVGAELPDTSAPEREVARAIDAGREAHPVVWTAAADMGLIDDEQWGLLACRKMEAYALDQLTAEGGRVSPTTYYAYRVPMLLATRHLTPGERDALADKVDAAWPAAGDHGALDVARMCLALFELLERPDRIDARREDARELLRRYWISGRGAGIFANVGGFSSDPVKFNTSFDDATWHGIELMARVGAPAEIDLRLLRSYLRRGSHSLLFEPLPYLRAHERAGLLRLEGQLGLPPRTWLEHLLAERLLIASVLIVALCLIALGLVPARPAEEVAGARP